MTSQFRLRLSLRLDPKTRFVLEFVSRVRGQSITTVVERGIKEAAGQVVLEPGRSEAFDDRPNWSDFWDPSEGVRMLKLLSDDRFPSTFEEDELRDFTSAHSEFFYAGKDQPRGPYVDILWPSIDQFLSTWRATKTHGLPPIKATPQRIARCLPRRPPAFGRSRVLLNKRRRLVA